MSELKTNDSIYDYPTIYKQSPTIYGQSSCAACGKIRFMYSPYDSFPLLCDDCLEAIKSLRQTDKRCWVADSKGGEPNHLSK